jgi:hypothetical protein
MVCTEGIVAMAPKVVRPACQSALGWFKPSPPWMAFCIVALPFTTREVYAGTADCNQSRSPARLDSAAPRPYNLARCDL